ncbi:hypothetical protein FZ041_12425 [Selenomonas caprae]|uniref:DNA-directed DNA polymerase n=1 Tax=Selenomonas caprae TaxID=2606905 RepID=A0A5D6WF12_9FIRM|nr:hypothetical protein FZ041_12425 [Selenomonas caprae]
MENINTLEIDIETYSDIDLGKCGVYRYTESPNFEILLFGVSVNGGSVAVYDMACGELPPEEILSAIADPAVTKWAHNASFERICLSAWLRKNRPDLFRSYGSPDDTVGNYLDPASWKCSMTLAAYNGLPLALDAVGAVLGFEQQKLKEGKDLIRYFCVPCKATKRNGGRTRNLPEHDRQKWELFKKYNKRDVEVEMQIMERLQNYPVPESVWNEYHISENINDRGIMIDHALVGNAIQINLQSRDELMAEMSALTGLENPNSVTQMQGWLESQGIHADSLGKKDVAALIKTVPDNVAEVLKLRQQSSKSSVKKYEAMQNTVCADGRCRGMFLFYGASRTGRFAGRNIQLQNLPQNHMSDLAEARELVRQGDFEMLKLLYGNVPNVLSELIRTAFVAKPGYKYVVSDFSAIEARVLSFLAGEQWRLEVFENNGDIYCASASQMFHCKVVKHGENGHLRQKGKIAELALGYGGSVGALKAMGALDMGLSEEELPSLVEKWRNSNPHITDYWWQVDAAVKNAVKRHIPSSVGNIHFSWQSGMLFITLPSGRRLSYVKPRMGLNKFGGESVTYMGTDGQKKWSRLESYGPKFVENIVQAVSRDILCYAMRNLREQFICGHVHDELIIECPTGVDCEKVCKIMGQTPPWLPGISLRADGYETEFYCKD